jgi:hypothetical protein
MGDFQGRSQFDDGARYGRHNAAGRDYMSSLTGAIQQHPVAAALVGMGVMWLFAGGSRVSIGGGDGRESVFSLAGDGASRVGSSVKSMAGAVTSTVSSGMSSAADAVSSAAHAVGGAVSDATGAMSGKVSDAAQGMMGGASGAHAGSGMEGDEYRNQSYRNQSYGDQSYGDQSYGNRSYGDQASGGRSYGRSSGQSPLSMMRHNIADVFDRYPLALAAAGLALGAGAAASIPLTDTEKTVMANASDAALEKARDLGRQAADVASAAVEEAGEKIGRQSSGGLGGNPAGSSPAF